ncbi:hypothetical protein [Plantactinospora sp. B5E13]|uniref:hypothetical protein n=1 Tax=Plantactinospora sp. B5E13 TaxID=3153758 RepID=UPI00325D5BE6
MAAIREPAGPDGWLPRWTDRYDEVEIVGLFPATAILTLADGTRRSADDPVAGRPHQTDPG